MLMTLLTGVLRGEERREQSTWLGLTAVNCSELCSLWYWELQQLFDTNLILPSSNSIHKRSKICKNLLAFSFKKPITERLQRSAIVKIKRLLKQRYIILEKKKTKLVYAIELWFLCNRFRTIVENVRDVADILRVFSQRDPGTLWSDSAPEWHNNVTRPGHGAGLCHTASPGTERPVIITPRVSENQGVGNEFRSSRSRVVRILTVGGSNVGLGLYGTSDFG